MASLSDLSPCTYFGDPTGLVAVGWLDAPDSYASGATPSGFVEVLGDLLERPWNPWHYAGFHTCTLCSPGEWWWLPPELNHLELGGTNLWVPGEGVVYVAPSLIIHYVHHHDYLPPQEFIDAVVACPAMESAEYFAALGAVSPPLIREYLSAP